VPPAPAACRYQVLLLSFLRNTVPERMFASLGAQPHVAPHVELQVAIRRPVEEHALENWGPSRCCSMSEVSARIHELVQVHDALPQGGRRNTARPRWTVVAR